MGPFDPNDPLSQLGARPLIAPPSQAQPALTLPGVVPQRQNIQTSADQSRLANLRAEGSGISQIQNPFLKGLATVGDIAGSLVAPRLAGMIPGTTAHHNVLLNQQQGMVAQDQASEENTAKIGEQQAKAQQEQAKAHELLNPTAKPQKAPKVNFQNGEPLSITDANTGDEFVIGDPNMPANLRPLADKATQNLKDRQTTAAQIKADPISKEHAANLNALWDSLADKHHLPKGQFTEGMRHEDAAQLQQSLNNAISKGQGDQHIGISLDERKDKQGAIGDRDTEREYMAANQRLSKLSETADAQMQKIQEARQFIAAGAEGQAIGSVKFLSSLASGAGSGVRITQAELNSIIHARGIQGDFEGFINRAEGKGALTTQQKNEMNGILSDVENRISAKMKAYNDGLDRLGQANNKAEIRQIEQEIRHSVSGQPAQQAGGQPQAGRAHYNPQTKQIEYK